MVHAGHASLAAGTVGGAPAGGPCHRLRRSDRRLPQSARWTRQRPMSVSSRAVWPSCDSTPSCCSPPRASTRARAPRTRTQHCRCCRADPSDLYNVTKLAGEALCLAGPASHGRVARLSNVYGIGMPAADVPGTGAARGAVPPATCCSARAAESAKDYVSVAAVVRLLPAIATAGGHRIYNLAAGSNTSHAAIARCLRDIAGWRIGFAPDAPTVRYPPIDTTRLDTEFGPTGSNLAADLPTLLTLAQECQCSPSTRHVAA